MDVIGRAFLEVAPRKRLCVLAVGGTPTSGKGFCGGYGGKMGKELSSEAKPTLFVKTPS